MANALVVNVYNKQQYDVYIGRVRISDIHWGNPFSCMTSTLAEVQVATREESVARYETWLRGLTDQTFLQERRQWILDSLLFLEGKILGCFCAPLLCHGEVLIKLVEEAVIADNKNKRKIQVNALMERR